MGTRRKEHCAYNSKFQELNHDQLLLIYKTGSIKKEKDYSNWGNDRQRIISGIVRKDYTVKHN